MVQDTGKTVISMVERQRERQAEPIHIVSRHWNSLPKIDGIPLRSDVDPRQIEDALEFAFVAERVTDGLAKLRVAGSHLNDLAGMSLAGMPLGSLFNQNARRTLAKATQALFKENKMVRLAIATPKSVWADPLQGEILLLPLRSDMQDVTRLLGCLVTQGCIGRAPRRFEITSVQTQPLDAQDLTCLPAQTITKAAPQPRPMGQARLALVVDNG